MKIETTKFDSSVTQYLEQLKKFPLLKHDEVVSLFQVLEKNESSCTQASLARKKLIECNLRLVVSIAKSFKGYNLPMEDLIQEGNIGLMKSIKRFDWKRGYKFSTYATWWIRQAMGQHVLKRKRTVRLPAHAATVQRKIMQASEEYKTRFGTTPSIEELIELVGASETVIKATMHSGRGTVSLSQPVGNSDDGDLIEDKIEDERPGVDPLENAANKQLIEITKQVISYLTPKEAAILRLRFGLVEDHVDHNEFPITVREMEAVAAGQGIK